MRCAVPCTMRDVRRLLVATDFGPEADFAIAHAGHVARRPGARVDLLHVQRSIAGDDFPDSLSLESPIDSSRREDVVACAVLADRVVEVRQIHGGSA